MIKLSKIRIVLGLSSALLAGSLVAASSQAALAWDDGGVKAFSLPGPGAMNNAPSVETPAASQVNENSAVSMHPARRAPIRHGAVHARHIGAAEHPNT